MARGTIVWRCWICSIATTKKTCDHQGGKYYIGYDLGGRRKWEPIGRNKKEAEQRLTFRMTELHQGTFRPLKPISFRDFSEQWLHDYAEAEVKPTTLRFYRNIVRTYLQPALGDLLLTQIASQHVQGLLAQCRRERGISQKTARLIFITLKTVLGQAKRWDRLRENPMESLKPPRVDEQEMDFLRPKEIPIFLKHADEPYRTLFLTAILTGMRRGELLGLQWGDIDWVNSEIHVRRTLYFRTKAELEERAQGEKILWQFSTPKSKKAIRAVIMSPRLKEALELHRLACPASQHDLVFCNKKGGPLQPRNMILREFFPALSRAGLRRIRFHDLRHTYTSLLLAQGENPKFIQSQLGHASIQTTLDRYGHLLPGTHRSAGEKLDAMVFGQRKESSDTVLIREQETPGNNSEHQETHR